MQGLAYNSFFAIIYHWIPHSDIRQLFWWRATEAQYIPASNKFEQSCHSCMRASKFLDSIKPKTKTVFFCQNCFSGFCFLFSNVAHMPSKSSDCAIDRLDQYQLYQRIDSSIISIEYTYQPCNTKFTIILGRLLLSISNRSRKLREWQSSVLILVIWVF